MIRGLLCIGLLVLSTTTAPGQSSGDPNLHGPPPGRELHDYYNKAEHPQGLLQNVEWKHLGPGLRRLREGPINRAEHDARFILNYFPNHPDGLAFLARVAIKRNKPKLAEEYFGRAIEMYPQYAETYVIYGYYLHRIEQLDRAIAQYKNALARDPDHPEAHYNLGLAYLDTNRLRLANRHAQQAYKNGYPLPGLRNRLQGRGAWNPTPKVQANEGD